MFLKNYKILFFSLAIAILYSSCTFKKNIVYFEKNKTLSEFDIKRNLSNDYLKIGDILEIRVTSSIQEASLPYNNLNNVTDITQRQLEGYKIDSNYEINMPFLGKISARNLTIREFENVIRNVLINNNHLKNPSVRITVINHKFTVLGEVKNPGTFHFVDDGLNILQAIGYAGDITIDGKRKDIKLIREENGKRKIYSIDLNDQKSISLSTYEIIDGDIIIVDPTFNKVKSAGFIGNPQSIASISSLILSITLLLINN